MENKEIKEVKEGPRNAVKANPMKNFPADLVKIWDELNEKDFKIFGLPGQNVSKFCNPIFVEPTKLYLKYNHTSVLPYLEDGFPDFVFTLTDRYISVERKNAVK